MTTWWLIKYACTPNTYVFKYKYNQQSLLQCLIYLFLHRYSSVATDVDRAASRPSPDAQLASQDADPLFVNPDHPLVVKEALRLQAPVVGHEHVH